MDNRDATFLAAIVNRAKKDLCVDRIRRSPMRRRRFRTAVEFFFCGGGEIPLHDICDYLQWPIGLVHKMAIEEMEERWQHKTEFQRKEALRVLDRADAPDRVKQTIKSNHARVR